MTRMLGDLGGRHVLVTGGAQGIGHAVVTEFVGAGATVSVVDRRPDTAAVAAAAGAASGLVADCGVTAEVQAAVQAARAAAGPVDAVVHAAGIGVHEALAEFTDAMFDRTFGVHVRGLCALLSACVPDWTARGGGSCLAVTSPAAVRGQVHGAVYAGAKSAVIGVVRSAALELAPLGVRVNAILPMAATPMTAEVRSDPALDATYLQRVPLGRWGSVEEIAGFCRFLVSDDGAYVTGAVLPIDGGRTI